MTEQAIAAPLSHHAHFGWKERNRASEADKLGFSTSTADCLRFVLPTYNVKGLVHVFLMKHLFKFSECQSLFSTGLFSDHVSRIGMSSEIGSDGRTLRYEHASIPQNPLLKKERRGTFMEGYKICR